MSSMFQNKSWKKRWLRSNETTSSSGSGIHFGHYIEGVQSSIISRYHALKNNIAFKHGFALDCWSRGIYVMLKESLCVTFIEKLRAILLMGADLNASYKKIFGNRMLDVVRSHGFIPEEIYSEKGKTAKDCYLIKVIIYGIVWQARNLQH